MTSITQSASWKNLENHYKKIQSLHMKDLFEQDPDRFKKMHLKIDQLMIDFSKNIVTEETINLLIKLANEAKIDEWRRKMFSGDKINFTENRSVLHTALRNRSNKPIIIDGKDIMPEINEALAKMRKFSNDIRNGHWLGYTAKKIKSVVNIGIGGSDLGPAMVCNALNAFGHKNLKMYFVSNVDGGDIAVALDECDPETTLFIVASKTFTTQETMTNANTAKSWLINYFGNKNALKAHFVAVSTNTKLVNHFGIPDENIFTFWDWVGGRYSLWSSIGLPIAIYIGMDNFEKLLDGAYEMDNHFLTAPSRENIPLILALISIWYINFFNFNTQAILPYDQGLSLLPPYLQQADMESNGKFVDRDNNYLNYHTGPIVWGEAGTNGQHAFYQLIHQGTDVIPADFIIPVKSQYKNDHLEEFKNHHEILFSHFIAQSRALMAGKTEDEVKSEIFKKNEDNNLIKHKTFSGNRPSNSIIVDSINPKTLGSLIALYEHKIFTQGIIWNINSFDQWGVEYGKQIAQIVLPELNKKQETNIFDSSTNNLINYFKYNK